MDWQKWDVIQLGRIAGALIVVVGIVLAGWGALDSQEGFDRAGDDIARLFLANVLNYAFSGFLVILLAELADRMGWRRPPEAEDEPEEAPPAG